MSGPVNLTGPAPVTNAEFTAALGRAVNRPTPLIVPGFALRTLLGEFAEEGLLGGQRAIPAALERAGFAFHHNTIGEALAFATAPKDTDWRVAFDAMARIDPVGDHADRRSAARHRRLPGGLAAAARARRRARRRRSGHPAAARAPVGVHRGPPHAAARSGPIDGTPVVDTDRGGKITWHGPGQLVGYPIIGLAEPLDVVNFVRRLEESMIKVCAGLGLEAGRVEGRSGVWVPSDGRRPARKIAAIGIRVSRATTLHGFALNCDCDLDAFSAIVPCGISDAGVTSLTAELGRRGHRWPT